MESPCSLSELKMLVKSWNKLLTVEKSNNACFKTRLNTFTDAHTMDVKHHVMPDSKCISLSERRIFHGVQRGISSPPRAYLYEISIIESQTRQKLYLSILRLQTKTCLAPMSYTNMYLHTEERGWNKLLSELPHLKSFQPNQHSSPGTLPMHVI